MTIMTTVPGMSEEATTRTMTTDPAIVVGVAEEAMTNIPTTDARTTTETGKDTVHHAAIQEMIVIEAGVLDDEVGVIHRMTWHEQAIHETPMATHKLRAGRSRSMPKIWPTAMRQMESLGNGF
jgi:hypothetical protein